MNRLLFTVLISLPAAGQTLTVPLKTLAQNHVLPPAAVWAAMGECVRLQALKPLGYGPRTIILEQEEGVRILRPKWEEGSVITYGGKKIQAELLFREIKYSTWSDGNLVIQVRWRPRRNILLYNEVSQSRIQNGFLLGAAALW